MEPADMSDQAADSQRRMWTVGDYPRMARHLLPISVESVASLGLRRGDRVLDVGVGDGNAAIEAARLGATVTGIDLTPAQIERARHRCVTEGVDVDLRVGDAQSLGVPDASFDAVISVMGMIFAPDHARACSEMARACRPGGTVALTSWAGGSWSSRWQARTAHLIPAPPPGGPEPVAWGDPDEARRRLAVAGLEATVHERPFAFRFSSVDEALDVFLSAAGPFVAFMEVVAGLGRDEEAVHELRAAVTEYNQADDGTCVLAAPYLFVVAQR
ncbi:MAG: methyltransferase domain-containing protein [Actinomycetota bacterium]|nr:methyltransferase domain-containing protein [Actinomycetota bacterium]